MSKKIEFIHQEYNYNFKRVHNVFLLNKSYNSVEGPHSYNPATLMINIKVAAQLCRISNKI